MSRVSVNISDPQNIDAQLAKLNLLVRGPALTKALRSGGKVVASAAKALCPRSTGSRDGWSASTRAARAGVKPLADTIAVVVRDYGEKKAVIVGPQYPAGALGHLVEFGHAEVLWGKPPGRRVPPKPFLRPAADQTVGQVDSAVISELQKAAL